MPPARPSVEALRWRPRLYIVLGAWLMLPILSHGQITQDGTQVVIAGELVREHPDELYSPVTGGLFSQRSCAIAPEGTPCGEYEVAWVSPPLALPVAYLLGGIVPAAAGLVALRFLAAGSLVAGMVLLWNRYSPLSPNAPRYFFWSTVLLTPMAYIPIRTGQTIPYLFLSACLGVTSPRAARSAAAGALWTVSCVFKLFPAPLALLLVAQRRWRTLLWAVGTLATLGIASVLLAPVSLWSEFIDYSREYADFAPAISYNGSIDILVHRIAPDLARAPAVQGSLRVAILLGLGWLVLRVRDRDAQWALAYLAAVPLASVVWWHYLWLAVPAVAISLAAHRRTDRELLVLPVVAAITVPISIPNGQGSAAPLPQLAFLVALIVAAFVLARPERRGRGAIGVASDTANAEP